MNQRDGEDRRAENLTTTGTIKANTATTKKKTTKKIKKHQK